jgi:hypothetical protein
LPAPCKLGIKQSHCRPAGQKVGFKKDAMRLPYRCQTRLLLLLLLLLRPDATGNLP